MATHRENELADIISGIASGEVTLLNLIKSLGEYLTATEEDIRAKGVGLLSDVLSRCPREKVTRQHVNVLVAFYIAKLEDTDTVIPSLRGLLPLASFPQLGAADAVTIVKAIFAHVTMKAHVVSTRHIVFKIFDLLLSRYCQALKEMGDEFLSGYVKVAEGEKDPRNLLLSFAMIRVIAIEFDIGTHVDNLYDITFCYFPITFKPPPNDPYGISTEQLQQALLSAMTSTPLFGPVALPLFIEKLSSSAGHIKRDTLRTLEACLPVYGPAIALRHASQLWEVFKIEVFIPADQETEACALKATQSLLRTLYAEATDDLDGPATEICHECLKVLREPEKNQAQHAIKVLGACIATTPAIARFALSQAIPHLIDLFQKPDEISYRAPILACITGILMAVRDVSSGDDAQKYAKEALLNPYKEQLMGALSAGVKSGSCRRPALEGMLQLVQIPSLLTSEELSRVVNDVNELLDPSSDDIDDLRPNALGVLLAVSKVMPKLVEEMTLPLLFAALPDHAPPIDSDAEIAQYQRILSSLSTLCVQPALFDTLVIRLSTKLDLICSHVRRVHAETPSGNHGAVREANAAYAHSILTVLDQVLKKKIELGHVDVQKHVERLVPQLYALFIQAALSAQSNAEVAAEPRTVSAAAGIISSIIRTLSREGQEKFASTLFAAYYSGNVAGITDGRLKPSDGIPFSPFAGGSPSSQKNLIALFSAAVIGLRKETKLQLADASDTLTALLQWYLNDAENDLQAEAALHTIATLLNKHVEEADTFVSTHRVALWNDVVLPKHVSGDRRRKAIRAWVWVTKALLVRHHPGAQHCVDSLFTLLEDEDVNWDVAKAVGGISSIGEDILNKKNYAVVRILYAQRFLSSTLPRILEGYRLSKEPRQQIAYLAALTSLIKSVPKSMYSQDLPTLMPLLLRGLDLPDVEMRANVVETLISISTDETKEPGLISEHASTIVTALLKNCLPNDMSSTRLRVAALRCLGALPHNIRYDILHSLKPVVIRQLARVLDDPKRAVRKEAVDTRSSWYMFHG
ncbi:hypothetical protein BOTBODRAFT_28377 [Botryobasidium botryosum FD-172 SS1]|uniref:MMS19 nucleotide excision repair protein n=1 Tax=Botryobasidium botryosum (strain FD-172 SS1) TaxID=930990 RepID=A0A067MT42_BOTB1|nr:hypothetical protein BOTBODRAFT_28377 [Botryobasidium botryosum FD-172 SS1]